MQNLACLSPNDCSVPQSDPVWRWPWNVVGGNISLSGVSTLVVAIVVWYVVVIAKAWGRPKKPSERLPPGPPGVPIFGNLPFLDGNLHHHLTHLAKTYGPIMSLRLGRRLCVVVSSPSIARELLKEQDAVVANHDVPTSALVLPNGLHGLAWAPHGQQWRTLRRLTVGGLLSNASLDPYRPLRGREIRQMVQRVHDGAVTPGLPVQVRNLVYSTLYNVITGMLWGGVLEERGMENVAKEFRQVVESIQGTFGRLSISDFFPILAPLDLQGLERERKKIADKLHQILDSIINTRLQQLERTKPTDDEAAGRQSEDFLQLLLRTKDNGETAMPLTMDHIKGLLLDLVMAGMDTTTITIEWAMSEMIQNKEIMRKAQEELDQVVGCSDNNTVLDETHLPKLHYLNAVVKETLRLHPATPIMLPRTPSKECTAGGYTIPEGCRIVVNLWGMERDPTGWDKPSAFKPERFLQGGKWDFSGNDFHFFPFGTGRRICPGAPLADRMLTYTLGALLHSFNWRLPEGTTLDMSEKFGVVLKKVEPLVVVPSRRVPDPVANSNH